MNITRRTALEFSTAFGSAAPVRWLLSRQVEVR